MRNLSDEELDIISGAGDKADLIALGGAIGGGVGVSVASSAGSTGAALLTAGSIGVVAGGAVAGAGVLGYSVGTWLNDNTPIQSWISSGFDSMGMGS